MVQVIYHQHVTSVIEVTFSSDYGFIGIKTRMKFRIRTHTSNVEGILKAQSKFKPHMNNKLIWILIFMYHHKYEQSEGISFRLSNFCLKIYFVSRFSFFVSLNFSGVPQIAILHFPKQQKNPNPYLRDNKSNTQTRQLLLCYSNWEKKLRSAVAKKIF